MSIIKLNFNKALKQPLMNILDQTTEIFCVFKTSLADTYKIPQNPINIKTSVTNLDLNELIKQILSKLNKPSNRDFDFIINGEILRGDLRSHLLKHKIENEKNITVDYVLSLNEPKPEKTSDVQNWLNEFFIFDDDVMACFFNGDIKVFDQNFNPIIEVNIFPNADEHQNNVNSFCVLEGVGHKTVVSCNFFGEMFASSIDNEKKSIKTNKLINLETSMECFYANPLSDSLFCSGDTNGSLYIWDLQGITKSEIVRSKERLHGNSITNLIWLNEHEILSTGLDDQLLISDVNTLKPSYNLYIKDNTITSVDYSPALQSVLTGHINGTIRVFDDRKRDKISTAQFKSHNTYVSSIKYCPNNDNIFLSGCYDGKIKLWDFRMTLPMYTIDSHSGEKIFDLTWLCKIKSN